MPRRSPLLVVALLLAGCAAPIGDDTPATTPEGTTAQGRFLAPVDLSGRDGGPEPVVVVAPEGAIWVAAQDAAGGSPHVWVSTDQGATFRESRPAGVSGGEVDIAVGRGVAFVTQLGPGGNVVSFTRDQGQTWRQSTFAGTNYFERELVAIDEGGRAYLASRFGLRSLTGVEGEDASVARSDDGGITFVPAGSVWTAQNEPGINIGNMLAVGNALVLSYNCRDGNGVCFARSADRGVTWTQELVVERAVTVMNYYPSVAAAGSRIVVVWSDASEGRLAVWGAASTDNGATWTQPARLSEPDESATLPWVATGGGRTWVVHLTTDAVLQDAGAAAADGVEWRAKAVRVDDQLRVQERALVLPDPVHVGVISKPLGRPGESGPYDRSFGDFFTVAVDAQGRAFVATVRTVGGASQDVIVAERR